MNTYVLWCITGAGHDIHGVVDVFKRLKSVLDFKVTLCFSDWGFRVARLYGVLRDLHGISSNEYMEEWLIGERGFYRVGRLYMGRYKFVVIAPASSNTIARIAHGLADTLPTLVFNQAVKSSVPVVIYPSDINDDVIYSVTSCYIDRGMCKCSILRDGCAALEHCVVNAIKLVNGKPFIDYRYCYGCGECVKYCLWGAVKCWDRVMVKPSTMDLVNIDLIRKYPYTIIVKNTVELYENMYRLLIS